MGTHTDTHRQTTPTWGRIIVADGIYSVGDKYHVYKNVEAQITLKFKNVVVISLVAIYRRTDGRTDKASYRE